ncbi:MAG: Holliday junction branch migration protein RuvA [Kiritimatiellae bacterium]|nr:Holliday junction branch migration protein RuvA [Kiritimatiellia bacterium]MBR4476423.1 Holliday junction branch migration protein RuvA [Kiritimatiellia bacterium]
MIAYIRGTLAEKDPTRVVIEAAGVGYELTIPLSTFDRLPKTGAEVKLLAFHCVREDDETLFGFATEAEKAMFAKLTSVSGVGPKIAIAILSGSSIGELSLAIASGNAKRISSIKGVGKKTAEKICIELKDKVNAIEALAATGRGGKGEISPVLHDAILALTALGFNEESANKMVSQVVAAHPDAKDTEAIIRFALKG